MSNEKSIKPRIAIIGLGYVGLPLAIEFSKKFEVLGYDINEQRINSLKKGQDTTNEVSDLGLLEKIKFTSFKRDLESYDVYIVTVPTPVDEGNVPNLLPLKSATETIAEYINKGDCVIYESTVYPGATEEFCVPILEQISGLKINEGFNVGYSPERIVPSDPENTLTNIVKITSGSNKESADYIDNLYKSIIAAGTFKASSIKVAEAAKVIENTQRDLNIALVNEFSKIFNKLDIDTAEVLDAADTKWNFLKFKPGLVGGHCISVDPYYLTYKAQEVGYIPEVILAGRRTNETMSSHIANTLVKEMAKNEIQIRSSNVLVMGFTFKGNCPDIRNTKIFDLVKELKSYEMNVDVSDHMANKSEVMDVYGIDLTSNPKKNNYDAIIVAVEHQMYIDKGIEAIKSLGKKNHVLYDLKHLFDVDSSDIRL